MTEEEYAELLKNRSKRSPPQSKPALPAKQVETPSPQETNTERPIVRITSYTSRLQDPDNVCPKYHIDALRYEGIIRDDRAKDIELFVYQVKVKKKDEERVEIEIIKK